MLSISYDRISFDSSKIKVRHLSVTWYFIVLFFTLFIGFRHEIGPDWFSYLGYFERASKFSFFDVFINKDPGYQLLNYISYWFGMGIYGVNIVSGFIFSSGIVYFSLTQKRPYLALAVAFPYLFLVIGMGYSRQAISIGIVMAAIASLSRDRFKTALALLFVAVTFHKSAVLLIPIFFIVNNLSFLLKIFLGGVVSVLGFYLILESQMDALMYTYVESGRFDSGGAYIRLFMCLVPSLLFLLYRKRFLFPSSLDSYWYIMSLGSVLLTIILFATDLSTAIDRVALYLLPIQIAVFSSLPDVLSKRKFDVSLLVIFVLLYHFLVLVVWLLFASHSDAWVPYVFFPFWYLNSSL